MNAANRWPAPLRASLFLLAATASAACVENADVPRAPVRPPAPVTLPAGLQSCDQLGAVQDGMRCRVYDTRVDNFSDVPDGTPEDALARRAFLYQRWLDLYNAPEHEVVVRTMNRAMAPGDPESTFGDDQYLALNDDHGDSAGFGGRGQMAALFRYASTGTDADHARLQEWVHGSIMQWDATGIPGYLARFHWAGVPAGTPMKNGYAMNTRDPNDTNAFDIPQTALTYMPGYYQTGIDINGATIPVQPSWEGHTSIDAYAGPMNTWPLSYDHIDDPELRARMRLHYGCFLKRLRIFKVIHLSQNAQLQQALISYLSIGGLHQEPDEPDLTKLDEIWGFYLPQYNHVSAAAYDKTCPAHLSFDALPEDTVDAAAPDFASNLILFVLRQNPDTDQANSLDFAYYPSARSGDAMMLMAYAEGAYHITRDPEFLDWYNQVLLGKVHADQIARTTGSFIPPKACRSYFRDPNVYTAHFMRTLLRAADGATRAEAIYDWERKLEAREEQGLKDSLFTIYSSAATDTPTADLDFALGELESFGGTSALPDTPRRNYSLDSTGNLPPDTTVSTPPAADITFCDTPISLFGITIPTGSADPNALYSSSALPVMTRPPDNWIWEKDPFRPIRINGDSGKQQYAGLDLLEPYWAARYFGYFPDSHLILVWGPDTSSGARLK